MKKQLLTAALILAGFSGANMAQAAETYTVDASHTNILLRVSHLGFSTMVLEALQPQGTLQFDEDHPEKSKINITLKSANIDGDDDKFNAHLHSADFFNAENYPEITFNSTKIKVTGENTGIVTGDLTMLGQTRPVDLNVTFNKGGVNAFSQAKTVGFTASGTLKRSDFGINYALPAVGDEVTLDINLEAAQAK